MNISLKNQKLELVKAKSSLQIQQQLNIVVDELRQKIKDLGDISNLANDIAFVAHICNLIENISKPKIKGREKLDLAIKLIVETFPALNNERDLAMLQKSINFIVDSGIVNKVSNVKIVGKSVCNFFLK